MRRAGYGSDLRSGNASNFYGRAVYIHVLSVLPRPLCGGRVRAAHAHRIGVRWMKNMGNVYEASSKEETKTQFHYLIISNATVMEDSWN